MLEKHLAAKQAQWRHSVQSAWHWRCTSFTCHCPTNHAFNFKQTRQSGCCVWNKLLSISDVNGSMTSTQAETIKHPGFYTKCWHQITYFECFLVNNHTCFSFVIIIAFFIGSLVQDNIVWIVIFFLSRPFVWMFKLDLANFSISTTFDGRLDLRKSVKNIKQTGDKKVWGMFETSTSWLQCTSASNRANVFTQNWIVGFWLNINIGSSFENWCKL